MGLILQENDLDKYVKEEVSEPEEAESRRSTESILFWHKELLLTPLRIT